MATTEDNVLPMEGGRLAESIETACQALERGALLLAPSESTYCLLAASGTRGAAVLAELAEAGLGPLCWMAPDPAATRAVLPDGRTARRLVERLLPGPAIFVREDAEPLSVPGTGAGAGAVGGVTVRGHLAVSALSGHLDRPLLGVELIDAAGQGVRTAAEAVTLTGDRGIDVPWVVDGGPATLGRPSTVIALADKADRQPATDTRSHRIVREGAYEARFVDKQVGITVLFVCTGNTCRSPMAEAITGHLLARAGVGPEQVHIVSAGTAGATGMPPSAEAVAALGRLGIEPCLHGSRRLTRQMVEEADLIYGMTRAHVACVLSMDPTAATRTATLDPSGGDVPDPIAMGQAVYTETAERIGELMQLRLREILA